MHALPQNSNQLNQAALHWLKVAKGDHGPMYLHLVDLAFWGLEVKADNLPSNHRYAVEQQVHLMYGWKPESVMQWLLSNPNEDGRRAQSLLLAIKGASSPRQAAAI